MIVLQSLSPDAETEARVKLSVAAGYNSAAVQSSSVTSSHHESKSVALMPVNVGGSGGDGDEEVVVSADDIPPQPRAPLTVARKQYLVEQ